ncbi:MAG: BamA/TamA family outer membrane protein [Acidobacteriota bacterium]
MTASVQKGPAALGVWLLALFALTPSFGGQDHPQPLIREIRISGLQHTRESVVREQLVCEVGRPYDPTTVQKDIERLDRLGVFSSIEIQPVTVTGGIVIEIRVSETIPYLVYPSFDANDENGLSAGLGVMTVNLFGRAVAVSGKARFGNGTTLSLDLRSPWRTRMPWWCQFEFHQRFRPNSLDDFEETASEIDFRFGRKISDSVRYGGRFLYTVLASNVAGITLSPGNRDNTPGLGFLVQHDTRDLVSNPHRGWWNEFELVQNGGFLGGEGDYLTANLDLRRYQPVAKRHTVAVFSLLTLQGGTVGSDVPLYQDFHIGGTNTIRGWDLDARHGKNQFLHTLEYRYELLPPRNWKFLGLRFFTGVHLAAFADAGTAWDRGSDFTRNFIGGGGFGIRLVMPYLSLLRFDFGFGEGSGLKLHFGIEEKPEKQRKRIR